MKRILASIGLLLFSQQVFAVSTIAGIDFINIANKVDAAVGTYTTNYQSGAHTYDSVADGNGASWVYSADSNASLNLSFGGGVFNVSEVDLSILFVGDGGHSGSISLLGGSQSGNSTQSFDIDPGVAYTNFNSSTPNSVSVNNGQPTVYGIYSTHLHLADVFSGTFTGLKLNIGNSSAVPSLVGTTAVVPVPAALWLFGSGLVGLAGIARKRA
jgi:hypothetical protein